MKQQLIFSNDTDKVLHDLLSLIPHDKVYVLCDNNTAAHVLPQAGNKYSSTYNHSGR